MYTLLIEGEEQGIYHSLQEAKDAALLEVEKNGWGQEQCNAIQPKDGIAWCYYDGLNYIIIYPFEPGE